MVWGNVILHNIGFLYEVRTLVLYSLNPQPQKYPLFSAHTKRMQNSMDLFTLLSSVAVANLFYSNAIAENFHSQCSILYTHLRTTWGTRWSAAIQLTRGTVYPLNCPDQERIKSANFHHSILANGLNEWERINAPLLLWRCSKNSQVNIVHSRYIISSFAQLPIHEQIKAILVLLKTRHKRKGRDMCWGKNVVNFVQ